VAVWGTNNPHLNHLKLWILAYAIVGIFTCSDYKADCSAAHAGACDASTAKAIVETACLGKHTCTLQATASMFGNGCAGKPRSLAIVASGCEPALQPAYVFDFGRTMAGFAALRDVTGPAGTKITLKYAEVLKEDGT
jgi:hypothetical protein